MVSLVKKLTLTFTAESTEQEMAVFVGKRVHIDNRSSTYATDPKERARVERGLGQWEHYGVITSTPRHLSLFPGIGTDIREEPHGTCRGGNTALYIPYGAVITTLD